VRSRALVWVDFVKATRVIRTLSHATCTAAPALELEMAAMGVIFLPPNAEIGVMQERRLAIDVDRTGAAQTHTTAKLGAVMFR
jgi:hypothetical protein